MSEQIVSKPLSEEGQKTWERIFGKKEEAKTDLTSRESCAIIKNKGEQNGGNKT